MAEVVVKTFTADIYIAGDYNKAKEVCGEYCLEGFCVNMQKVDYIYTFGQESGIRIGLINYPRFPSRPSAILSKAKQLARKLMKELNQGSFSIVTPSKTYYYSRRREG